MIEAYVKMFINYADFSGRSRRRDYWLAALMNFIIGFVFTIIAMGFNLLFFLLFLYCLAIIIPSLALSVRRLHDIGKSGWWLLIGFIPVVGGIILLVFSLMDSDDDNQYGLNPKAMRTITIDI